MLIWQFTADAVDGEPLGFGSKGLSRFLKRTGEGVCFEDWLGMAVPICRIQIFTDTNLKSWFLQFY